MPKSLLASAKYPHQAHQSPQSPAMIASPEHLHHHHAAAAAAHHQHHHQAYYSPSHHVNMQQQQQQYQDQMQQQQQHHYTNGYGRSANLIGGSSPSHMQMSPSSSSAKSPYFASPSLLPPNSQSSQQQQSNGQQQHSPHNYIDANNNAQSAANQSGNGLLFNSKALQHLNNTNLGGVINNLINSSLIHNPAAAAAAGNASTPSAAAVAAASTAAATAYLLNQSAQNSHNNNHANASATAAAAANLILANLAAAASQSAVAAAANSAAVAAAAAASNGGNQYTVDESKCHVCGDKSTGSHFGGISCESCKAFFRRSVQRNRFEDYKCSYNGECKMNTNTRKICQFCRYKSCLAIGMRPKWVLSDDERHQKYGSRRKQNKPKPGETSTNTTTSGVENEIIDTNSNNGMLKQQPQTPQSQQQQQQGGGSDEENSTPSPKDSNQSSGTSYSQSQQKSSELSRVGIDGIDMRTHALHLNSYEKDLIDRLSVAFYHSRKHNTIDLNVNKKMAMLFQTQSEGSLKKMSKVILANFIVQPVKRVITFAKLIPDFRKLDIHDQMCLLQGGTMEIFIMSSSSLYDQMSNKFDNVVSKDRNIKGNDTSSIQLDMFRLIWSEDVFEKTIGFLKSMMEMRIDEATLILILPLILFSPDRRDLKNRHKIYINQAKYSLLLKKYLIWKYGLNQETMKLYNRLLLKLIELRTLHEMHSSILLDADPTQLEPFPLALIMNEKEDARHFKSDETPGGETTPPTTGDRVTQPTSGDTNSGSNSRPNETDTETAPASVQHSMPPTPLTASSLNAPQTVTSGSVPSKDQFSSTSILTPSSNGGYSSGSTGGQLSSVSSPTTALESPFMADTPHTNASTNIGSCTSSNSMVNSNSCHVDEHLVD